jgi:ActR/RegA family two-component response regulator
VKGQPARKVLLIEEHPDLRLMLGLAIGEAGFEAYTAETIATGLQMLGAIPDVVVAILDANLDGGLITASFIRNAYARTALIVMLDNFVAAPLPAGVVYLRKLAVAADVAGVLGRTLGDHVVGSPASMS